MKAIILAVGKSTRLYPLTSSLPKCLLTIKEKAILDYQIEALIAAKIEELILVVGFNKQKIYNHLSQKKYPIKITFIENNSYETNSPILGGLFLVMKYMNEQFIFLHCDSLFEQDALFNIINHPHGSVMLYRENEWDEEAGKIIIDPSTKQVLELGKHIEKDRATGEYLQIAKFDSDFGKSLISVINERNKNKQDGYTIDAFNDVVKQGSTTAIGLPFTGFCMEIDTKEDYTIAKETWK